jgi:hypothetical protein
MSSDDRSTVGPDDPEFDVAPADEEFADSVPYDESLGEITVTVGGPGVVVYLPDRFALHDDADLFHDCDELDQHEHEPLVDLHWNGIQDDYHCMSKDHAIALATALMEAVRQLQ